MSKNGSEPDNKLVTNLLLLQNVTKRDPEAYETEFIASWNRYNDLLDVFEMSPGVYCKELDSLVSYLSHVSHCFTEKMKEFPKTLEEKLRRHATAMDPTMRMNMVKALIMLKNKELVETRNLLKLFFSLLHCKDKLLRTSIYNYVVQDIKRMNSKSRNVATNTVLQNFLFTQLNGANEIRAKMALAIMTDLYKRNVWKEAKIVNFITSACLSKNTKVLVGALKFFLGSDPSKPDEDSDSDDELPKKGTKNLLRAYQVGKKCKKREKKRDRALQNAKKRMKNKKTVESFDFSALRMIHDPQDFSEKLLAQLQKTTERFEVKLMMIDLISRLIGVHQLFLERFYPYLKRFLQPHQREVTKLLLFAAQASHELVPPEDLEQILRVIADNFISDRNSSEVMAVGLNAVREICSRCPLAIGEDLLQDLVQYKSHKIKAVMMAARALIQVYRHSNPELLHRKDRGKPTEASKERKILGYGETMTFDHIPGAETLLQKDQEDQEQKEWESASEEEDMDDDDSDGWIDVHHSSDEETEQKEETPQEVEDRKKLAQEVSSTRIMTQEDFRQLREAQLAKEAGVKPTNNNSRKRKRPTERCEDGEIMPSLGDIENVHKKRAHDRDSRLATVIAGREGRGKFSHGHKRMNPHASTTNQEKNRSKAFMMVKHNRKLKEKKKRSFKDKAAALRNSLLKEKKRKKK